MVKYKVTSAAESGIVELNALKTRKKIGVNRSMKKTPAFTIVAACIRALMEVGPVIAVTSHSWKGNCALFANAPREKNNRNGSNSPRTASAVPHVAAL